MLALLFAAAVARPPVLGLTPTFQAVTVKNGKITWTEPVTQTVNVAAVKTRQVERNGRSVTESYTVTEQVPVAFLHEVTLGKEATFRTAGGRSLTYAAAAESLLRRPVAVLYTGEGEPLVTFLAVLRDDTVVVRRPTPLPPVPLP